MTVFLFILLKLTLKRCPPSRRVFFLRAKRDARKKCRRSGNCWTKRRMRRSSRISFKLPSNQTTNFFITGPPFSLGPPNHVFFSPFSQKYRKCNLLTFLVSLGYILPFNLYFFLNVLNIPNCCATKYCPFSTLINFSRILQKSAKISYCEKSTEKYEKRNTK